MYFSAAKPHFFVAVLFVGAWFFVSRFSDHRYRMTFGHKVRVAFIVHADRQSSRVPLKIIIYVKLHGL